MASGVTRLSDVVVPQVFVPMVQRRSVEQTALITSGAMVRDPFLDNFLNGAGLTINMPKQNPVDTTDVENVSSDDPTVFSTPNKVATASEIAVRLSRNNSWSEMDLVRALLAADPLQALVDMIGFYWSVRRQKAAIAQITGILANNAATTDAYHTQNDMSVDLSTLNTSAYLKGTTDFHGSAFIDAFVTMGDQMGAIALVAMHSVVYATALKNNLIQFRMDADANPTIPTYMSKDVIMDDSMPNPASGVFETWLLGRGSVMYGDGTAPVPAEVLRVPGAGNGGGQEIMWSRVEWSHHVPGTAYIGTSPSGGPDNTTSSNMLAAAGSWRRVTPSRKYVPIARLKTREF